MNKHKIYRPISNEIDNQIRKYSLKYGVTFWTAYKVIMAHHRQRKLGEWAL